MSCENARDLLMEASPNELRGEENGELARHVRQCSTCAALARAFLAAGEELDREIGRRSRIRSDEEILRTVRRELAGGAVGEDGTDGRLRSRRLWWIGAPLAAAAALATVLLVIKDGSGPTDGSVSPDVVPPELTEAPAVDVAADRRFAVMQTDDSKIHVVWFY